MGSTVFSKSAVYASMAFAAAVAALTSESMSGVSFSVTKATDTSVVSIVDAPRIMPSPRSAKIRGGLTMFVRAA